MTPTPTRRAKKPAAEPVVERCYGIRDDTSTPYFAAPFGKQWLWSTREEAAEVLALGKARYPDIYQNCRVVRIEVRDITRARKGAGR